MFIFDLVLMSNIFIDAAEVINVEYPNPLKC
ncbi:unnamed protein product, partial [marine sediment metagenome]